MPGNDFPPLDEILIPLAQDWWSIYGARKWEMNELELVLHKYPERQSEFDAAYEEFEAHPFWQIVGIVSQKSGLASHRLREATRKKFDGHPDIVRALNELNENGTTAKLFAKLYDDWPEVAERLFGAKAAASTAHRRGRKKADYKTRQREAKIAADWEQAHSAGTYKAEFAKLKRLPLKDLEKLLGRVRKNKARADK